jgi:hypothetical protein
MYSVSTPSLPHYNDTSLGGGGGALLPASADREREGDGTQIAWQAKTRGLYHILPLKGSVDEFYIFFHKMDLIIFNNASFY